MLHFTGFPGSHWLERVPPAWNIPVNAIIVSAIFTSLLSLIDLGTLHRKILCGKLDLESSRANVHIIGSYTAFNAFNSLGTVSILFSYNITIGCLIWRRCFGEPLPQRRWSLGPRTGLIVNIFALCATTPMLFFYTWPLYYPVITKSMQVLRLRN
jgi:choline transport protein